MIEVSNVHKISPFVICNNVALREEKTLVCPIAAVCNHKFNVTHYTSTDYMEGGNRLGLCDTDICDIIQGADMYGYGEEFFAKDSDITVIKNKFKQALGE